MISVVERVPISFAPRNNPSSSGMLNLGKPLDYATRDRS